jgi:hypothetical protein
MKFRPIPNEKVDTFIKSRFSASFMNNTKWEKLIDTLTAEFDCIYVNYKLIYNDKVNPTYFQGSSDFRPYFQEPTFYKEVEWIEFPKTYNVEDKVYKHGNLITGIKKPMTQDINKIEEIINKTGKFMLEKDTNSIKLVAYRI